MSTVRRESERVIAVSTVTQNTESMETQPSKPRMRENRLVAKG